MKPVGLKLFAWLILIIVVAATVCPLGLRPTLGFGPEFDRIAAYFVLGSAFALAYRRHLVPVLFLVVVGAFALESLQLLEPDRHARVIDAAVKAFGGAAGLAVAWTLMAVRVRNK